jgi:hypothetical protein
MSGKEFIPKFEEIMSASFSGLTLYIWYSKSHEREN